MSSRTICVSELTYTVQVVGAAVGLLADADGSQLDSQVSVIVAQPDDYYLKVEATSGTGIRGQYLVDFDVQDLVSPRITSISGLPAEGGTAGLLLNPLTVYFSEDVRTSGSGAVNTWDLRAAGADGLFDTSDDEVYALSRSASSRSVSLNVSDGPLQPGEYRLTTFASGLVDRLGNLLDGNADGTGGDDLTRLFSVAIPTETVLESRSNNSIPAATPLPLLEDPVGSGLWTSSIGWGVIDPAGESDYWSFSAQQGDQLVVTMESLGLPYPLFYVYNAAGQQLFNSSSWSSNGFGSPAKATNAVYTLPATGTYYVQAMDYYGYAGAYQLRVDLGRGVPLEPNDANFANNSLGGANALSFTAGDAGHLVTTLAGSLYSQEGVDYFALGRLDPGNQIEVSSRTLSLSTLGYRVQVVGNTVGLLPDEDGSQQDTGASITIGQTDDYYLKVEALSGVGIRGRYLVDMDVQDVVPPRIMSISGLPAEGGTAGLLLNPLTVYFSEDVQTAGSGAAGTWDLRAAGVDGLFDTADDELYTLSRSVSSRSVSLTVTDGPLQAGSYRFTARASALLDRFANPLDGNADGTGGDDLVRTFAVVIPEGYILEDRANNLPGAATSLSLSPIPGLPDGTFAPAWSTSTGGSNPYYVASGLLNGDGYLDVVTANYGSHTISVLLGQGNGTFAPAVTYAAGTNPMAVALADFNGDGQLDVVGANSGSHTVSVWLGSGDGTLGAVSTVSAGSYPYHVVATDVNGDGRPDLLVANYYSNAMSVLLGQGDGTFQAGVGFGVGSNPIESAVGDWNRDGWLDVAVANYGSNTVSIRLGNGDGTFGALTNYGVGSQPNGITAGDFDGDGWLDLAVANYNSHNVSVLRGQGDGTFSVVGTYGSTYPYQVIAEDLNGDGQLDLAVANYNSSQVSVLVGQGDGTFAAGRSTNVGGYPISVVAGDYNDDGELELVTADHHGSSVTVLMSSHDLQPLLEDPVGSGLWTSSIGWGVIDPAGESDYWSFSAQQGDQLVVTMESLGLPYPLFYVYNAAGQQLFNSSSWSSNGFGSPAKATNAVYTLPATGTYYVQAMDYYGYTGAYQLRVDLGRGVPLEPNDANFANNSLGGANALSFTAGDAGHLVTTLAGSLYSQEGVDYFALGRLDPGNQIEVSSRTLSLSTLGYRVQVVGNAVGLLPDEDGSQQDTGALDHDRADG